MIARPRSASADGSPARLNLAQSAGDPATMCQNGRTAVRIRPVNTFTPRKRNIENISFMGYDASDVRSCP